jgi:hypothetical protein
MVGRAVALAEGVDVTRRLLAAAVMLGAAVLLALFARDVWHWQRAMEDADARSRVGAVAAGAWNADTTLPAGVARRLLGLDDDLAFRRAAMHALQQVDAKGNDRNQKVRSVIEATLGRIVRHDTNATRASRSADYLGVLLYNDPPSPDQAANAYEDPSQGAPSDFQTPEQKAELQFSAAVRLDPDDDNAARNLELMLRRPTPPNHKGAPRSGGGEQLGQKGSGARPAGHGY